MITGFETITYELTDTEKQMAVLIAAGLKIRTKDNPIKEPAIISAMTGKGYSMTGARLRKIINHLRTNAKLPIIATSKGYYVSYDKLEIAKQIKSLEQRANSILTSIKGLETFL